MQTLLLFAILSAVPIGPASVTDRAVVDLADRPKAEQPYIRYLSVWPTAAADRQSLDSSVKFWVASMSNRRVWKPPQLVADGELYRLDLRNYGWTHEAWEQLAKADPYFKVSYKERRGWVDPRSELALRTATGSIFAVVRADWFVARTSLDVGGSGFFKGFYSAFKGLPGTEAELFKLYGIDEKYLGVNYLLRGGAVLQSIVAIHNRELQLFPTVWGRDVRFLWRSLDTDSDVGESSAIQHFQGSVKFAGKEFIGSNQNGTHYYYLANAAGKQVSEVPANVAQDKSNPHDSRVLNPYSCVRCHGPQSGIRDFSDVVSKTALGPDTALAVISKEYADEKAKFALEEYYLSELGTDIGTHQKSYGIAVRDITGLEAAANTAAYVETVERHLFGRVSIETAAADCGVDVEKAKQMLKYSGNPHALVLLAGNSISREAWESCFADVMRANQYPWEN